MIISKKMSAAPYLCCRHHAHDGQGNSNNRSKATLQGMALPSRFLSVPPLNPQRTNFNFELTVSLIDSQSPFRGDTAYNHTPFLGKS